MITIGILLILFVIFLDVYFDSNLPNLINIVCILALFLGMGLCLFGIGIALYKLNWGLV